METKWYPVTTFPTCPDCLQNDGPLGIVADYPDGAEMDYSASCEARCENCSNAKLKAYPSVELLARQFVRVLKQWLSETERIEIDRVNLLHPENCATGDVCDSNMAMDEAWLTFPDTQPDGECIVATSIWNEAWNLAKTRGFRTQHGQ